MWVSSLPDERAQWRLHCIRLLWAFPTHIVASQLFHSLQGPSFTRVGLNFAACSKVKGRLASFAWKYKGCESREPFSTTWQQQMGQSFQEPPWDPRGEISHWKAHQPTLLSGELNIQPPLLCYKAHTAECTVQWQLFSPFGAFITHVFDFLLPLEQSSSILCNSCKPQVPPLNTQPSPLENLTQLRLALYPLPHEQKPILPFSEVNQDAERFRILQLEGIWRACHPVWAPEAGYLEVQHPLIPLYASWHCLIFLTQCHGPG